MEEGLVLGSQLAFLGNPQFLFTAGKKCGVCVLLRGGGGGGIIISHERSQLLHANFSRSTSSDKAVVRKVMVPLCDG